MLKCNPTTWQAKTACAAQFSIRMPLRHLCPASSRPKGLRMVRALPSTREQAQLAAHAPQPGATVLAAGVLGTVAASSLWAPLLALAEDIDTQAEAGLLVEQASRASQSASDTFVSVAFTIVIGLLLVVTLGVGYLSFVSWLDSREENKARLEESKTIRGLPSEQQRTRTPDADDKQQEELMMSLRRGESKRDKSRGFASAAKSPPREF